MKTVLRTILWVNCMSLKVGGGLRWWSMHMSRHLFLRSTKTSSGRNSYNRCYFLSVPLSPIYFYYQYYYRSVNLVLLFTDSTQSFILITSLPQILYLTTFILDITITLTVHISRPKMSLCLMSYTHTHAYIHTFYS